MTAEQHSRVEFGLISVTTVARSSPCLTAPTRRMKWEDEEIP